MEEEKQFKNIPVKGKPFSIFAEASKGLKFSSSGLVSTCILRSMISDCCLNNILGLSKVGRLSISLSDIFLTSTGLGDIGLSVLRLKGDIRNSLSFLSSLDRGANGGLPKGVRRLFPGIKVGFVLSLMSEACWSLSVLRSSSSLSTLVSTRSRFLVFSSDVRSS